MVNDMVEFRGAVKERADLRKLYEEADLFIMPSALTIERPIVIPLMGKFSTALWVCAA